MYHQISYEKIKRNNKFDCLKNIKTVFLILFLIDG